MKHTGWNPDQIFQYMIWNFDKGQKDNWNPDKYGGFSWLLPSKSATGEPANLPQEVLDFHAAKKEKKAKEVKDKEKFNFNLKIKNNTMYLRRVTDNKKIELSLGPSWKLYDDKDGKVLWAGSDCPIRPEFCHKIFNAHSDKDKAYEGATKKLSGVAQASQPLPGMVATSQGLFVAFMACSTFQWQMNLVLVSQNRLTLTCACLKLSRCPCTYSRGSHCIRRSTCRTIDLADASSLAANVFNFTVSAHSFGRRI